MTHMLTLCDHKQHFVSLKAALQAFRIAVDEAQLTFVAASWCECELPQMQCICVISSAVGFWQEDIWCQVKLLAEHVALLHDILI